MRIAQINLTHVRVPLVEPFRISSGAVAEKDAIVVELKADEWTGYGESSPMSGSFYSTDTPESSWRELCDIVIPAVLGREYESLSDWSGALERIEAGRFTKCGMETALWDIEGQRLNQPIWKLLGGERPEVLSGLAVGLYDSIDDMLGAIERYLRDGYARVKLKIQRGHDVEIVKAARRAFGNIALFVDANGAYSIEDLPVFQELDEYGLLMFEQPFPANRLEDLAKLQAQVRTPLCLDESLETVADLDRAIELGSVQIANIKIQRVGGFGNAMKMYHRCVESSIPVWVGTMPELGIGQAQGIALATLGGCVFPTDVEASTRWFRDDIIDPFIELVDGSLPVPKSPGLGFRVDPAKLEKYAIASRRFSA
ncbi:MAG: o-succinylbenzoate synthase [Acidobacteriota bacterium]|nr:o-succinylbenzoate synthase [Acidobacteriota bacterium]